MTPPDEPLATYEADLTWMGTGFHPRAQIAVGADGRIEAIGSLGRTPTHRLRDAAILPGMVNAHSHAFQRGLRGRGERFPAGSGSFWTWREAMYDLVERTDEETFYRLCHGAFREMLAAGITACGEFHYFHHATDGADYRFDRVILDAARTAGIRVVLLNAFYASGGFGVPLAPAQRRFGTPSTDDYWRVMDELRPTLAPSQTLGVVAHSIRAVAPSDLDALRREADRRGWVFHMHVEEQPKEIEDCRAAYGATPMALLTGSAETCRGVTAVHATHTTRTDLARFLGAGGGVCVCPTTEANLGDGIPDFSSVATIADSLSLGTDSNARISMVEEMRWLEYGQRLARQSRGLVVDGDGHSARALFTIASANGARALGLDTGRLEVGRPADFFTLDLTADTLAGADEDTLLDSFVFGADNDAIAGVWVGGVRSPPR